MHVWAQLKACSPNAYISNACDGWQKDSEVRLTRYTDYAMRVLLYLGARPGRVCSISEMARAHRISQNHLMKVVNDLGRAGYVESIRGRTGGIRLGRSPDEIQVGSVVRYTEEDFDLADCASCIIAPACSLRNVLAEALQAFMAVLDRYTLADLLTRRTDLLALFQPRPTESQSDAETASIDVDPTPPAPVHAMNDRSDTAEDGPAGS
jgi:Rrf2 family nitric oxide-sensitive transcriptional repressor